MGEERLAALIQESLAVATRTGAAKPADFAKVIVDTTVQPKAVAFPTDAKLMHRARERLVRLAKEAGVGLRQSYARVGKIALIAHQRYAHAKQFKRANRALRTLGPISAASSATSRAGSRATRNLRERFAQPLYLARRVRADSASAARQEGLLAARARGRMHRQGQGASPLRVRRQGLASPPRCIAPRAASSSPMSKALPGNPYDGHTLATVIPEIETQIGANSRPHRRRPRLSRPQRPARAQVQGLYLRPEAPRHAADQARIPPPLGRRTGHRPCQGRAPHGPKLSRPEPATPPTPSSPPW